MNPRRNRLLRAVGSGARSAARVVAFGLLAGVLGSGESSALPFNQDMVSQQLLDGHFVQPQPAGAVTHGSSVERYVPNQAAAMVMTNPVRPEKRSLVNGRRLYHINCSPCHGRVIDGKHVDGAMNQPQWVVGGVPNLFDAGHKAMNDGYFFMAIHFGIGRMPSYGWKLSMSDHWDIVNFIRSAQDTLSAPGVPGGPTPGTGAGNAAR